MKFSNIFEKLGIIFKLIMESNVFTILMILIIAVLLLRLTNKINNKKTGFLIYLVELIALLVVFFIEKDALTITFNKLIDNIFLNFYFPSVYVYLFVFAVSVIIFVYTLFNRFISKTYKTITNIYFFIFNFIFIMLVNVVSVNNIDIFAKESLFTNNNTLVLLELSTLLFLIYLIINTLVYFTNSIILFVGDRKVSKETYKTELEILNNEVFQEQEEVIYQKPVLTFQELVKNIELNDQKEHVKIDLVPEINDYQERYEKINLVPEVGNDFKFIDPDLFEESLVTDVIKNNTDEVIKEKLNFIDFNIFEKPKEEKLTLNDYKLFSNMLKTVIQNNNNSNLTITDILNKNLLERYSFEEYSKFEKILNSCLN